MAMFINFKFSKKIISPAQLILYGIITWVVTWNKIIYFPLLFLLFLVPKNYFEKVKSRNAYIFTVLLGVLTIIMWWNKKVDTFIYPFNNTYQTTYHNLREDDYVKGRFLYVNPRLQLEYMKKEPVEFILTFIPAVFELYSYNNDDYVSGVGWGSIHIHDITHRIFVIIFLLYIFTMPTVFSKYEKWFLIGLAFGLSSMFLLSQHLHWDVVGKEIHRAYLGKYFIAIYPLIFMGLMGLIHSKWKFKNLNLPLIVSIILILAHIDMIFVTIDRFY
jgi:uncharacterized membrane protein